MVLGVPNTHVGESRETPFTAVCSPFPTTQPLQVSESAVVSSFVDSVARGGVMRELVRLGELTLVHHDC